MELKRVAYGLIMAGTLIFVRFIDLHVYDMPTLIAVIILIAIMVTSYKMVDQITWLNKKIARNTYYMINVVVVSLLILAFYSLELS
ncbi:MAG: hypothetical protein ABWX61_11500 [Paenisporosarcina sp.]